MLQLGEHFKYKNEKDLDTCKKDDIVFVYEPNTKRAYFKTGIIDKSKPFQDGKTQIAVVKCVIKGRIATLTQPINRPILSRLVHAWWIKISYQNWNL